MEASKRYLKSSDNIEIEFPEQFGDVCLQFKECDHEQPLPCSKIHSSTINLIKQFYEAHDWSDEKVQVNIPLQSDSLKDEIDEKSFEILSPYAGIQNINKMVPLIDAAFFLNLEGFKNACMASISYEFVIGSSEEDLKKLKEKHNIVITPEEEKQYGDEFEIMFKELNEKKKKEMEDKLAREEEKQN